MSGDYEGMARVWVAEAMRMGDSAQAHYHMVPAGFLERIEFVLAEPCDLTNGSHFEARVHMSYQGATIDPGRAIGHYRQKLWLR